MQTLSNDYNVKIIRIYCAAGHGKSLIDAMLDFGVKSILCRDVIGLDQRFADSKEICQYLRFRNDERMAYSNIDSKLVDKRRSEKKETKIKGCMLGQLFVYEPNSTKIVMNKYLADCESCLNLEFSWCKNPVACVGEIGDDFLEESMVDEDDDRQSRIYEFTSTPSYVNLLLCNASDPVYFVLVEKKGQATEKLQDRHGHVILPGKLYLEGPYLHKSRSYLPNKKKFKVLDHTAYISPGEIFDDVITMGNESYSKYLNFA